AVIWLGTSGCASIAIVMAPSATLTTVPRPFTPRNPVACWLAASALAAFACLAASAAPRDSGAAPAASPDPLSGAAVGCTGAVARASRHDGTTGAGAGAAVVDGSDAGTSETWLDPGRTTTSAAMVAAATATPAAARPARRRLRSRRALAWTPETR